MFNLKLQPAHSSHFIFTSPLFQDPEFITFAERVQQAHKSDDMPESTLLARAMPEMVAKVNTMGQTLMQSQNLVLHDLQQATRTISSIISSSGNLQMENLEILSRKFDNYQLGSLQQNREVYLSIFNANVSLQLSIRASLYLRLIHHRKLFLKFLKIQ